jgi:hypothetical protein
MTPEFSPVTLEDVRHPLWEIGWVRGVERSALREHLGHPHYIETDSARTFGGEEDWWSFKTAQGEVAAVCLRVPYQDAVLCSTTTAEPLIRMARELLRPLVIELFEEARLR